MYSVVLLLAATTSMETNSCFRHRHHGCCAVSSCSPCYTPCAPVTCCPTPCGGVVYGPAGGGPGIEKIPVGTKKMPVAGKLSPDEEKGLAQGLILLKKGGSGKWTDKEVQQYADWYRSSATPPEDRAMSLKQISAGKLVPPNPKMDDKKDVKPAPKPEDKKPAPKTDDKKDDKKGSQLSVPARVIVLLPANAILTVDGQATTSTSSVRNFVTPALSPSGDHFYEMRATFERDGVQLQVNRTVRVRPGETTQVTFDAPATQGVAQK